FRHIAVSNDIPLRQAVLLLLALIPKRYYTASVSANSNGIDWFRTLLIRNCSIFKDQFFSLVCRAELHITTFVSKLQLVFLSINLFAL
ncbi:hypothetical protein, partial [Heliomicrobium gestii]|uniref:hypothetical protein n=1 Tax=Heliomicrobium gestii TaxID=2699 RepID=UPI001A9B50DB